MPVDDARGLVDKGITGWLCRACMHVVTFLNAEGKCPNCRVGDALEELKTRERLHAETEAMKERQRFQYWQPGEFNPHSWESQLGHPLTSTQVLEVIRKWIPGAVICPQFNAHLGRTLAAFYIPDTAQTALYASPTETHYGLKFVCCSEMGIMPEWDIIPRDDERPFQMRGWRSVLGIFYRMGYIPFVPDDGRRLGWYQIRESPIKQRS